MEWIAGFVIAATVGLTGMGGGSFTVPLLVLVGLPTTEAVGTAMIFASVVRLMVAPIYMKRKHVHARYLGLLLIGAVPGLLVGTWALRLMHNPAWKPAMLLPGDVLTFSNKGGPVTHVGLYVGDRRFIHSATRGVQVSTLSEDDPYGRWWYRRWVGVRRILR